LNLVEECPALVRKMTFPAFEFELDALRFFFETFGAPEASQRTDLARSSW
jgi:hypothetical protein